MRYSSTEARLKSSRDQRADGFSRLKWSMSISLFSCDLSFLNEGSLEDIWQLYLVGVKRPPHYQSSCWFSIPYSFCQLSELDTRENLLNLMGFIINPNPIYLIVEESGYWII